jgi:putative membrane protein
MYHDEIWMGFGGGFIWFFWILVILAIVLMLKSGDGRSSDKETPLEILKRRYANGEIDDDEYQRKKKELEK